ncbi:hypothetical protein GCM10007874_67470 [Labrys miyagiensis]|uniref:Cytochrome b/b6 C-terminal region profile domain-containing protein n=1 Tax=Labrys miyagiensis TaxID=346912 RepID=A0ABQ6CTM7_9HYPH|nr:hypothetical protein [Labrys miyagiensis]GLS23726.1 hypothetical protein GCM10007874_67470 [Labrys miyagiensis]
MHVPDVAPELAIEHVEYLHDPFAVSIRFAHVLAVSALFALIYLRLALALVAGKTSWVVLGWSALLIWSLFLAVSGKASAGTQANFWFSQVFVSAALNLSSLDLGTLSSWLYWHLNGQAQWTMFHVMLAGMMFVFSFALLLANLSRISIRLSQLSWASSLGRAAFVLSLTLLIAAVMTWPGAFDDPSNSVQATPNYVPAQIIPEWYLSPWFEMLRSGSNRAAGSKILWAALLLPMLLSALFRGRRYPLGIAMTLATGLLAIDFIALSVFGRSSPILSSHLPISWLTAYYFLYFLLIIPALAFLDTRAKHLQAGVDVP